MIKKLNCVLLIDDDEPTNYLNQMIIEDAEITENIVIKYSAKEALDFLGTKSGESASGESIYPQPELIFLDINMPGMNGWEFLEVYKKLPEEQKGSIVIVMLTTSLNPDDKQKADEMIEVRDFKHKPLTVEELHDLVKRYYPDHIS